MNYRSQVRLFQYDPWAENDFYFLKCYRKQTQKLQEAYSTEIITLCALQILKYPPSDTLHKVCWPLFQSQQPTLQVLAPHWFHLISLEETSFFLGGIYTWLHSLQPILHAGSREGIITGVLYTYLQLSLSHPPYLSQSYFLLLLSVLPGKTMPESPSAVLGESRVVALPVHCSLLTAHSGLWF